MKPADVRVSTRGQLTGRHRVLVLVLGEESGDVENAVYLFVVL